MNVSRVKRKLAENNFSVDPFSSDHCVSVGDTCIIHVPDHVFPLQGPRWATRKAKRISREVDAWWR